MLWYGACPTVLEGCCWGYIVTLPRERAGVVPPSPRHRLWLPVGCGIASACPPALSFPRPPPPPPVPLLCWGPRSSLGPHPAAGDAMGWECVHTDLDNT